MNSNWNSTNITLFNARNMFLKLAALLKINPNTSFDKFVAITKL